MSGRLDIEHGVIIYPGDGIEKWYDYLCSATRDGEGDYVPRNATNQRALILGPGKYTVTETLDVDTNYVNIVSLTGNPDDTIIETAVAGPVVTLTATAMTFRGITIKHIGTAELDMPLLVSNSLAAVAFDRVKLIESAGVGETWNLGFGPGKTGFNYCIEPVVYDGSFVTYDDSDMILVEAAI